MKKLLSIVLILTIFLCLIPAAMAQPTEFTLDVSQLAHNEGILSMCWVKETLYMLGNETIYCWKSGETVPQVYWQCPGLQNYRYLNDAPEAESAKTLWEQTICYLLPGEDVLYALQPYSGQIFEVTNTGLLPSAIIPQSMITYQQGEQTINREIRTVAMQGSTIFLLLGTNDPDDWEKTSLISFEPKSQQSKEFDVTGIRNFVVAAENQLILILNDSKDGKAIYQMFDPAAGSTRTAFSGLTDAAASSSTAFWQGQLLNCTSGQITAYAEDGTSKVKAYVPGSSYYNSSIVCNEQSLCAVSYGSYVFLRDITYPSTQTVLHVMGDVNPSDLIDFSLHNPDIAVVSMAQLSDDALQQSVLSAGSSIDLYVVDAPGLYSQLKEKGYLASLNDASDLKEKVSAFYPCIQDVLLQGDQLLAYPISINTASWTLNQTLWQEFNLGDVPKTYTELLDMMQLWQDDYSDDNPDYTLVDLPGDVAACVKLLAKEYILQCGSEYPDFSSDDFKNAMLALIEHQDTIIANGEQYGMPLIYSYYQGFGIGYNDSEKTRMMLMPAVNAGETQNLSGTLSLLTMSSSCSQQDAALRFITYLAQIMDTITEYMLTPSLDTPLRREGFAERIEVLTEEKIEIEKALASASNESTTALEDRLAQKELEIASLEEDWLVSEESISNYRAIASNLIIPYNVPLLESSTGFEALESIIDAACGQTLTENNLNALLESLNRVARMVMLEAN